MSSLTYADAGVDIDKANALVDNIKKIAKQTRRQGVMGDIGGFGGLFSLNLSDLKNPVLVSSTDGVGTKLKIAFMAGRHDTVGIDLVAMCVNDIAVQGAKPLFFLDYMAVGKLNTEIATQVITGIGEGCKQAKCALIGGETAEMPGFYKDNEYDLAGFTVGIVESDAIIDGSNIHVGDAIIGIASSGLHSNGFSLVRKICFDVLKLKIDDHIDDLGKTLAEELLTPTIIYSETVHSLLKLFPIHGIAHITGGGLAENVVRVLPQACVATIRKGSWDVPPVFSFLQKAGKVEDREMTRTFNNGIGLVVVVPAKKADDAMASIRAVGEKPFLIGEITPRKADEPQVQLV
ncbi:phosphoribosylformylglycinamidine cyclo-ligase [Desulfosudis oleivorans]|uniref:Phosphoribosylformylglycinamidine cyclo-ligase n=1 Tax=Desulfosudis oleivorans (strain DSM 6200 / JCM 39069 / Hxd3) TaxID=96561 RepID=A8ZS85_DESOH|nr:phosphoribosylformylglycinamidine cyclo-ligase [Desulfosudis oleivorans]ABW66103.1 phosphoribosylformylglycinamidine cyclo-ligase [Desulfosudis oleivorans Hxd3]